jgi:hypothetical protein
MIDRVLHHHDDTIGVTQRRIPAGHPQAGRQMTHVLGHLTQRPRLARHGPVRPAARALIGQHQPVAAAFGQQVEIITDGVIEAGAAVKDHQREHRRLATLLHEQLGFGDLDQSGHYPPEIVGTKHSGTTGRSCPSFTDRAQRPARTSTPSRLIGPDAGGVARFPTRDRFAACNGTAPVEVSPGSRNRGTTLTPARPAHTPHTGSSDQPLPLGVGMLVALPAAVSASASTGVPTFKPGHALYDVGSIAT